MIITSNFRYIKNKLISNIYSKIGVSDVYKI